MQQRIACPPAGVRIAGTGQALPSKVLTNDDLAQFVDTSDEWITKRTGIKQRYVIGEGEDLLSLGTQAVRNALADAELQPQDLDLLILATLTPEMTCPSAAARVVDRLGATPAGAFDLAAACSGFVYGMNVASSLIASGFYKNIAVLGVETMSTALNWEDRSTCVLFGDGAGAAIFSPSDDPQQGCLHQIMQSNGSLWAELYVPREEKHIPNPAQFNGQLGTMNMNGREVYKFAVNTLQSTIENALQTAGYEPNELTMIVPHQSNIRIMESARDKLGLPPEKMYINIDRYGNTSGASAAICLHELRSDGKINKGDLVLFTAMGGGMTWTNSLWRL